MDNINRLELQNEVEIQVLNKAIRKRMDVLSNGYNREDVIEYLTLFNISARINPQLEAEEVPFAKRDAWML